MPASVSGWPGPGEMTSFVGLRAMSCSRVIWSFRYVGISSIPSDMMYSTILYVKLEIYESSDAEVSTCHSYRS